MTSDSVKQLFVLFALYLDLFRLILHIVYPLGIQMLRCCVLDPKKKLQKVVVIVFFILFFFYSSPIEVMTHFLNSYLLIAVLDTSCNDL